MNSAFTTLESPIGRLLLVATDGALGRVDLMEREGFDGAGAAERRDDPILDLTARQLSEYFAGARRRFEIPLRLEGTPFQKRVWRLLVDIPHGETRSYGDLARLLARPGASRAIGGASSRNPIAIIVPCHRVIASDGGLGGYSGGEQAKRWLLSLEAGPIATAPAVERELHPAGPAAAWGGAMLLRRA